MPQKGGSRRGVSSVGWVSVEPATRKLGPALPGGVCGDGEDRAEREGEMRPMARAISGVAGYTRMPEADWGGIGAGALVQGLISRRREPWEALGAEKAPSAAEETTLFLCVMCVCVCVCVCVLVAVWWG